MLDFFIIFNAITAIVAKVVSLLSVPAIIILMFLAFIGNVSWFLVLGVFVAGIIATIVAAVAFELDDIME